MGMNCPFFDKMENVSMYMDSKYYICQFKPNHRLDMYPGCWCDSPGVYKKSH